MSYEPTLIIKKSDLAKHESKFEHHYLQKPGIKKDVYEFLNDIFKNKYTAEIDGIELLVCRPELTSFNNKVREVLRNWNVGFGVSY